jgi:hypothetical protein
MVVSLRARSPEETLPDQFGQPTQSLLNALLGGVFRFLFLLRRTLASGRCYADFVAAMPENDVDVIDAVTVTPAE